ncbi:hypothetical protein GCM10009865_21120 [Aeromicrobium ponti]
MGSFLIVGTISCIEVLPCKSENVIFAFQMLIFADTTPTYKKQATIPAITFCMTKFPL